MEIIFTSRFGYIWKIPKLVKTILDTIHFVWILEIEYKNWYGGFIEHLWNINKR